MNKSLLRQLWRFGLVGVAGFIVNASLVESLVKQSGPVWAQIVAFPVAATVTWWLNRHYTFGSSGHALHHEWLRYIMANSVGWIANNGVYMSIIFTMNIAYIHPAIAVAGGSIAGLAFNFSLSRVFVFKSRNP